MYKKYIITLVMIALAATAIAAKWDVLATTSGSRSADALIYTGACAVTAITVATDGTNDASVIIYNNTTATGTPILPTIEVNGADKYGGRTFQIPVYCNTGLYVDVTGTGATYAIEYIQYK